jgi:HAD superfamily hydrolase (TIGR01509 family)
MIFDLILFDCDGTLVDTEPMNKLAVEQLLAEQGLPQYTSATVMERFFGIRFNQVLKMISTETGHVFPEDMSARYIARARELAPLHFKPIAGARALVMAAQKIAKTCVASNGQRDNVLLNLKMGGLEDLFTADQVLTAIEVDHPKPAPDLFLLAARRFGVDPSRCLVIEDSPPGVEAAIAAGMHVWGFTGAQHDPDVHKTMLLESGAARVFHQLIHIKEALDR